MSFPFPREPGGVPEILGSIFENLPSMVFVKDAALLRFVTVNRAAEELLGFSREELIGKSDHDFFPADQADGFTARDRAVLMSGREVDIAEETILTRHRGVRVLHTKKVPLLGADGAPKFLLGISEDITELKDVERRLRESEHQLRRLLEAIPDLIFRIDRGGRFLSFVPARGMRTLAPESEFIGKTFADVMPPELSRMAGDAFERALLSGETQVIEYDLVEGGKRRYYEARIVPVGTDDFISIVRDVSDRRRAEEAARERERQLSHAGRISTMGEMATSIAHELNQPLAAILNHAEACTFAIQDGRALPESLLEDLQAIVAQAERATRIVRHVRNFVRKGDRDTAVVNLNELVETTLGFLSFEASRAGVSIETELPSNPIPVYGDPIELQQVVLNLVRNGIEAIAGWNSGGERTLRVATRIDGCPKGGSENEWGALSVSNPGPALTTEAVSEFLEPYFTTKPDGLGLGLSISRSIVEGVGGNLEGCANPDGGVTFQVWIPIANKENPHE